MDVAGLEDTDGHMVAIMNSFICKILFKKSRSVRFLVPITHIQLNEGRGIEARALIDVLRRMCQVDLSDMSDSI